jgi:hypothetical protein
MSPTSRTSYIGTCSEISVPRCCRGITLICTGRYWHPLEAHRLRVFFITQQRYKMHRRYTCFPHAKASASCMTSRPSRAVPGAASTAGTYSLSHFHALTPHSDTRITLKCHKKSSLSKAKACSRGLISKNADGRRKRRQSNVRSKQFAMPQKLPCVLSLCMRGPSSHLRKV